MRANLIGIVLAGLFCAFLDWSMSWPVFEEKRPEMVYSAVILGVVIFIILVSMVWTFFEKIFQKS